MAPGQALGFGESGIPGWAITRTCLCYPISTNFSRVVALTNRPVAKEAFLLPDANEQRLQIHGCIDLTKPLEAVLEKLKTIDGIEETIHVY